MKSKLAISGLYKLAEDISNSPKPALERDIKRINITDLFYRDLYMMHKLGEIININITAKPRLGKSTVAQALGKENIEMMNQLKITNKQFNITNIARTQYELMRKMINPELQNTIIIIDEFDDLETTGQNATLNESLLKHFQKIQAARYIHRIYCSPSNLPDDESDIILNVYHADKTKGKTYAYIYYKYIRGETKETVPIGKVIIDVNHLIKNWIKQGIEQLFRKEDKTETDEQKIKEWRQKDPYIEYMCRKIEKMNLVNKHGIFRTQDLDYSDIYYKTIKKLEPLTKMRNAINTKRVKSQLKRLCRQHKIPTSIVGDTLMTETPEDCLQLMNEKTQYEQELKKLKKKFHENKINAQRYEEENLTIREALIGVKDAITDHMTELQFLQNLKRKYYGETNEQETNTQKKETKR